MQRCLFISLGALLFLLGIWWFRRESAGDVTFRTAEVVKGALTQAVTTTGTLTRS